MNITFVSPFDPNPEAGAHVGGVERALHSLSARLARRGNEVTLLCSSELPGAEVSPAGVTIKRVRRRFTLLRTPIANLAAELTRSADVIHVPATYPFTTVPTLRRARALGIPSVLDFHFEPTLDDWIGKASARLYAMVGPRHYALARAVIVRSRAYARSCRSLANIPDAALRIIPNGVDSQRFRPSHEAHDGAYLLFVGRLVPYKGVSTLLHALALVPPGLPLVVAGEGPLRHDLELLARRLQVDVRFVGRVPEAELPRLYGRARLTVLPSVNSQEAFGLTLLESMACGTPVVASDLPGVAEVAALGGLLAPPADARALGLQIRNAMAPGVLVRGRALASPIRAAYSWDAVADRLMDVYHEVVDRPGHAASDRMQAVRMPAHPGGHPVL